MNLFFNVEEQRPRVWIRIPLFLFISSFVLLIITGSFNWSGFQFIVSGAALFGVFWFSYRFNDNRSDLKEAGLKVSPQWWKDFGIGTATGFVGIALVFVTEWVMGDLEITGFAWDRVSSTFWLIPFLAYFVQMLSVGFYEEVISRAYLIPNLKEGFTFSKLSPTNATWVAILFSSALFGLGHAGNPNVSVFAVVNIVFAGIMLALPYVLTGQLSYSVGLHFSWNFFQGGVFGFRVSGTEPVRPLIGIHQEGNPLWTGGSFGPEGGIIGLIAILLMTFLLLAYIRKQKGNLNLHSVFTQTFLENKESSVNPDELT